MNEAEFVSHFRALATALLPANHRLNVGMNLYYEVVVDSRLRIKTNVAQPMRGQSAFQTDLCLVEVVTEDSREIEIPRVVFEFKVGITTHDILTYSAKARKHKTVYPYLRYGVVIAAEHSVPRKFFIHNEAMDFCFAIASVVNDPERLQAAITPLLLAELAASKRLEAAAFGKAGPDLFRQEVILDYLEARGS